MIKISYSQTEAARMRDRIRVALDKPDSPEGKAAAAELRALACELDVATCGYRIPVPAADLLEVN